jgi:hypothetical protein
VISKPSDACADHHQCESFTIINALVGSLTVNKNNFGLVSLLFYDLGARIYCSGELMMCKRTHELDGQLEVLRISHSVCETAK